MATNGLEMSLYPHESLKKNKTGKQDHRKCVLIDDRIEVDDRSSFMKYMINMKDLEEVEMNEEFTLDKNKHVNIICLKKGKEIQFLKADSSAQMEGWYRELVKILKPLGWKDLEPESTIEGLKRRITNPGRKRQPGHVHDPRQIVSAVEPAGWLPKDPKGVYEITGPCEITSHDDPDDDEEHEYENIPSNILEPLPPRRVESLNSERLQHSPDIAATTAADSTEDNNSEYMELNFPNAQEQESTAATNAPTACEDFKEKLDITLRKMQCDAISVSSKSGIQTRSNVITVSPAQPVAERSPRALTGGIAEKKHSEKTKRATNPPPVAKKPSVQLKTGKLRGSAQVVKRDEMVNQLREYTNNFRRCQDKDSIRITLKKDHVASGKRLCLVKVHNLTCFWFDHWNPKGCPREGTLHPGDQILSINGIDLEGCDIKFAYDLMAKIKGDEIPMTVRRAPYAHVVHLQRTETCTDLGIELHGNLIKKVSPGGLFDKSGRAKTRGVLSTDLVEWAITEINMQHINFNHTSKQIQDLLGVQGQDSAADIALVIQPSDLIQAMKAGTLDCPQCGGVSSCHHNLR